MASPSGGGELWTASWRWWERRPRVAVGLAAPSPYGGVWRVEGSAERQTYANGAAITEETAKACRFRGRATGLDSASVGRWNAGLDSWSDTGRSFSLGVAGEQRLSGDRLALRAGAAGVWRGGVQTWTLGAGADGDRRCDDEGDVWLARGGVDVAADGAPLALWGGAGTGAGQGRAASRPSASP